MISVIMSVYNAEKYISQSIESILSQTYDDFEFIIINDCSTDNTLEIIQKYAEQDNRIKLFNNKQNIGLTKSLNKAIQFSNRKYIARMDADDIAKVNRFEKQVAFLEKNSDIDIVGSFAENIDKNGEFLNSRTVPVTHEEIYNMLLKLSPMIHPTVMFRRESLEKINYYNGEYRTGQDYDLWFRAMAEGLKFYNLPLYLLKYRIDENYFDRQSFKHRLKDLKIRCNGYSNLGLPIYKWYPLFIPLILGVIPDWIYKALKKVDPRNNFIEHNKEE